MTALVVFTKEASTIWLCCTYNIYIYIYIYIYIRYIINWNNRVHAVIREAGGDEKKRDREAKGRVEVNTRELVVKGNDVLSAKKRTSM